MNRKFLSYIGLFFVVFIWGTVPIVTLKLYDYYSPTVKLFFSQIILLISYLILSHKQLHNFNMNYIKSGIITGIFLAFANVTQKIGLMYTTPAKYAFLENLSCITVPITMYILVKKKANIITVISSITCLMSAFLLSGMTSDKMSGVGIGEILCAIAGLLYGFNIAGTSVYAKNLYAPLYLAVQAFVGTIVSFVFTLFLNTPLTIGGNSVVIEKIVFSFKPVHILAAIIVTLISSAMCWIIRTNASKHIDASIISVIMPFSSVLTGIFSVLTGHDTLSINLISGGLLSLLAILMSCFNDIFINSKK